MSGRETRVRIGTLEVAGGKFDAARFRKLVTERLRRSADVDRASIRSAIGGAAAGSVKGERQ